MHRHIIRHLVWILTLLPAATAQADPIVVRAGALTTSAFEFSAPFSLIGTGDTRIDGRWPGGSVPCSSCRVGDVVTPSARFLYDTVPFVWGDPFASGSATIAGTSYPRLFFSGELLFTGSPFTLPGLTTPGDAVLTFRRPFTFTGEVSGYDRLLEGPTELYPLFTTTWAGRGTADVRFFGTRTGAGSFYTYLDTTYTFADPIPEPATLLLCGTGVAVLIRRRASHRRKA